MTLAVAIRTGEAYLLGGRLDPELASALLALVGCARGIEGGVRLADEDEQFARELAGEEPFPGASPW